MDVIKVPASSAKEWRKRAGIAALLVLVVLCATAGVRWTFGLRPFKTYGDAASATVAIGQTVYVGNMVSPRGLPSIRVDVRAVTARVRDNTSAADVAVWVCTISNEGVGISRSTGGLCSTVTPFRPGPLRLGHDRGDQQLLLAVTPHLRGRTEIDGVNVRVSGGFRRGSDHTGLNLTVVTH